MWTGLTVTRIRHYFWFGPRAKDLEEIERTGSKEWPALAGTNEKGDELASLFHQETRRYCNDSGVSEMSFEIAF
jgi:hypothetical protein